MAVFLAVFLAAVFLCNNRKQARDKPEASKPKPSHTHATARNKPEASNPNPAISTHRHHHNHHRHERRHHRRRVVNL